MSENKRFRFRFECVIDAVLCFDPSNTPKNPTPADVIASMKARAQELGSSGPASVIEDWSLLQLHGRDWRPAIYRVVVVDEGGADVPPAEWVDDGGSTPKPDDPYVGLWGDECEDVVKDLADALEQLDALGLEIVRKRKEGAA